MTALSSHYLKPCIGKSAVSQPIEGRLSIITTLYFDPSVGEHHQKEPESSEKTHSVSHVFHYPWYRGYDNDIALMKLKEPIEPTEYVQPLCLPPDIKADFFDKECVATGWGKIDYSTKILVNSDEVVTWC